MKKLGFIVIFLVTFFAIASDKNIICATSACSPDFTPINQFEKIYYSSIDAGTNNLDNINVSTVVGESPRSLRLYVENNSKDLPKDLTVDLSSKSQEFNGGDALVIGDYFNSINLKLNGYSGTTGKSASEMCADKFLIGGTLGFGDYAKAEFQSKRIANPALPVNKCTAADVDFLQQNNFSCDEDGYNEISKLDPVVSVTRFKGKTKCLGVGFKDVCVQKTVKVTCNWLLKYPSGYSSHPSENITKYFVVSEQEWFAKNDDQKKKLCLDLTKGSDSDPDATSIISNGNFTTNADTWTLSGNIKYANSKIKTLVGPELKLEGSGWSTVSGQRAYSFIIGYTDLATRNSKGYTYAIESTESNVSCSGLNCRALFPYSISEFKNGASNDGLISLMKLRVTNPSGVSNVYDVAFKFESVGDSNTGYYQTNCAGTIDGVKSANPSVIVNSFNAGYGDVCAAMRQRYTTTYQEMFVGGVSASSCYANNWQPVNGCLNNETVTSQYGYYCIYGTSVDGNMCATSTPNTFNYSSISSVIKPKLSLDSRGIAKKVLNTESNETYRVTGVFYSSTEDKMVSSAGIRIYDNTGADVVPYLVPTNGDVVVENGEVLTIPDEGILTYNSLHVKSGGTIILNGNQFHTIYAKKFIQIDGQVKTALNNYAWSRNVQLQQLLDGSVINFVNKMSSGGLQGGGGGKGGQGGGYNYGGGPSSGNGGGGGCWQIWYGGGGANSSCGGAGQLGNNPGGCIGVNNSAPSTVINYDGCGSGGGGGARGAHSGSLVIVTPELKGSGSIKLRGQSGGNGMTAGYTFPKSTCDSLIESGQGGSIIINSDGSCIRYTGGGSGGGGAGGSGGSLYIKADKNTLPFDLGAGSGGRSGYSGYGGARGGYGAAGSAGAFIFEEIQYYAQQNFDDKGIAQADVGSFNEDSHIYPLSSYLTTRIPHYFDFTFVARSNSTNLELYQYIPNSPGYFDNIEIKKVNPNSGPPVKPNGTVENYQGIDGLGYFDMPTVPSAESTTIGYDNDSLDLLVGSSWKLAFTDLGAECPLFHTKIPDKTNYLTSIIAYDTNDDQCDDVSIPQDPNSVIVWKNIGIDRKLEFGYETIACRLDNCPVQNVVQTFDKILMELNIGLGISGTQQGEGLLFTYDYNNSSLQSQIGQPGYPGANDIPAYKNERICAKVQDAITESETSVFAASPSVNFKRYQWQALKVSGENAIPKTPINNNKGVHLFKKIDSSVRYLLKQELL